MPSRRELARTVTLETADGQAELVPDPDRPGAWLLLLDGTPQSHVDLDDPTRLEFDYIRWLAHVAAVMPPPADVLHLGGGGLTLARYLAVVSPQTRQRVVESNGELVGFVRKRLPLPSRRRPGRITVRVDDARSAVAASRPASVDLVVLDAFAGAQVPAHLTTVEFLALVRAVLRQNGWLAVNLADGGPLRFARAMAATLAEVFTGTAAVTLPATLRGRRFGNLVLIASASPNDRDVASRMSRLLAAEPFPARFLTHEEVRGFAAGATAIRDAAAAPSPMPPAGWLTDLAR